MTTITCEEELSALLRVLRPLLQHSLPSSSKLPCFDHVLEVGCGTGTLTRHLAPLARKVTAVDVDKGLQGLLLSQYSNVSFRPVAPRGEPFDFIPAGDLDAAFFYRSLHFVPDAADALARVARLLKPGGAVVVVHKSQLELGHRDGDPDLSFMANRVYQDFCTDTFSSELARYWTSETAANFTRLCDPDRRDHRNLLPPPLGATTHLSVPVRGQLSLLDLRRETLQSSVAKAFQARRPQDFENAYQTMLNQLCELLDYPPEDVYFEDCCTVQKRVHFYVQIHKRRSDQ